MVQILKDNKGFSLAEILVGTLVLAIAVLAFFASIKSSTRLNKKASTNDAAYSIARQRLSLMQDGDLLVRQSYKDSTDRDGVMYYTLDEVTQSSPGSNLPSQLTVTVSWGTPTPRTVSLSGYLNRDICPDTAFEIPPHDLSISNTTIPVDAPTNTLIGELKVHDVDSSDLHMYLYDNNASDNEFFKVQDEKLYTAKTLEVGELTLTIVVSDCAGNETTFDRKILVTPANEAPEMEDQAYEIAEDAPSGTEVAQLIATPINVQFRMIGQEPAAPFSLGLDGALIVSSVNSLNYEDYPVIKVLVEVKNLDWYDTATVLVSVKDVNEPPVGIVYTGGTTAPIGASKDSLIGHFKVIDPDSSAGDTDHEIRMSISSSAYSRFAINNLVSPVSLVVNDASVAGTYVTVYTANDKAGHTFSDSMVVSVTTGGNCGAINEFVSGFPYVKNQVVYNGNYIYTAKYWTKSLPYVGESSWRFSGACDGFAVCSDFIQYAQGGPGYNGGTYVYHDNMVYTTDTWIKNNVPPAGSWVEVVPCK